MSNAASVLVHRFTGFGLSCTKWPRPTTQLLQLCRPLVSAKNHGTQGLGRPLSQSSLRCSLPKTTSVSSQSCQPPASVWTSIRCASRSAPEEKGLAFQEGDLSREELDLVFGPVKPPPNTANRLLRILHGRRNDGTLDLKLPLDIQAMLKRYPYAFDSALYWLRVNHQLDEDAAIMARIDREEQGEEYSPSELEQRAQDVGLYAPQSGNYQAKLSKKEGDVFGQSEIDRIRERNIAAAAQEEEKLQMQIDKIMHELQEKQEEKNKALALRPETGLESAQEIRPPNSFDRWVLKNKNAATSELNLDSPEVGGMSVAQRILPSAVLVALFCLGCYFCAQYWVPPKRSERWFPDASLSFATVTTIFAVNVFVFTAWRLPPMWPMLNKYFITTPAYPRALSMIGNVFSHQTPLHLLANMAALFVFGLSLHEDVGRGVFVGMYLASGAMGSLASLSMFALRRNLVTSSLGASGSVWGITAAYFWLHGE